MTSFVLRELADFLKAELRGDGDVVIRRINTLKAAQAGDISFLASDAYRRFLPNTRASAVILRPADLDAHAGNVLIHPDPYVAYARLTSLFSGPDESVNGGGVHPSAVIHPDAKIAGDALVGPHVVVEAEAEIGPRVRIGPGCVVGRGSVLGADCALMANITLYHGVSIGERVRIHSGTVIGADGFGFANDSGHWVKIHQLGGVVIGNDVEIGACTTIDRGALGDTVIGNGVIIDNQVQIAHNVRIGDYSALAGCAAVAGSTVIGRHCMLAGGAGLVGHIELCDGGTVTARSMITGSITKPGVYSSGTGFDENGNWRKNAVRFSQLDNLARRIRALELTKTK